MFLMTGIAIGGGAAGAAALLYKFFSSEKSEEELNFEITKISQTINRVVRNAGSWYIHSQVLQGFTQLGEVLGASVGPGGDQQDFNIKIVDDQTSFKYGLNMRRVVHNNDFLHASFDDLDQRKRYWIDLSLGLEAGGFYKRFLFEGQLTYVYSLNYQWEWRSSVYEIMCS